MSFLQCVYEVVNQTYIRAIFVCCLNFAGTVKIAVLFDIASIIEHYFFYCLLVVEVKFAIIYIN